MDEVKGIIEGKEEKQNAFKGFCECECEIKQWVGIKSLARGSRMERSHGFIQCEYNKLQNRKKRNGTTESRAIPASILVIVDENLVLRDVAFNVMVHMGKSSSGCLGPVRTSQALIAPASSIQYIQCRQFFRVAHNSSFEWMNTSQFQPDLIPDSIKNLSCDIWVYRMSSTKEFFFSNKTCFWVIEYFI